jgi:hypothetical protein
MSTLTTIITVSKARKILGTSYEGLSNESIKWLLLKIEALTDVVIAYMKDSKNQLSIDNSVGVADNEAQYE